MSACVVFPGPRHLNMCTVLEALSTIRPPKDMITSCCPCSSTIDFSFIFLANQMQSTNKCYLCCCPCHVNLFFQIGWMVCVCCRCCLCKCVAGGKAARGAQAQKVRLREPTIAEDDGRDLPYERPGSIHIPKPVYGKKLSKSRSSSAPHVAVPSLVSSGANYKRMSMWETSLNVQTDVEPLHTPPLVVRPKLDYIDKEGNNPGCCREGGTRKPGFRPLRGSGSPSPP